MKIAYLDLDGTLVDSKKRHVETLKNSLLSFDFSFPADVNFVEYKSSGYSTRQYLVNKLGLEENSAKKVANYWSEHIEDEIVMKLDEWYPDAEQFLQWLKERKYYTVVLTARQSTLYTQKFVYSSKYGKWIDEVHVVNPVNAIDNKLDVISSLYDEESILVGDTENEYEVGYAIGIRTFLLNRGFRNETFWKKKGVKTYSSLVQIEVELEKNK